jgi:putative transposase
VKDCYSNKIVGYSIDARMKSSLAVAALRNAIALRNPSAVVVHSDRGSQFRSGHYRHLLREHGLTWIERKYHRKRRQRGLGKLTPVEFETIYHAADAA